ncbi:MAG: hypothetical protein HRU78_06970 [Gammaproteobacteria bacterium]|nr:MAG: hypothetical protein HRU78_06970 [Gammaproteobacteria bacterium]
MKLLFLLFVAIVLLGCQMISTINQRPVLDVKLIGVWTGEYLEEGGALKRWKQVRNADGTYRIEFSFTEKDETVKSFIESGRWWIQGGLFHEIALPEKGHPDKYRYSFKKKDCVSFELVESEGFTEEEDSYKFSECLEADSPPANFSNSI